jgi:uncharacterized protein (TIGR02172 family)
MLYSEDWMMKADYSENKLTIFLSGRVDTANVFAFEKDIRETVDMYHPEGLVLDAAALDFISSAGLRVILKLRKEFPDIAVINVSTDVYEVLEMTGFTEIMKIEKAYRVLNVADCSVVGEGANGMIYRVGRDTIVKVYKDASALEDIKRERELSRTAFILGIPTAIPYDVVRVGDSFGSVFEMLDAKTFAELLAEDANNLEMIAQETVKLMKTLHATDAPENIPRQSDTARAWLKEAEEVFDKGHLMKLKYLIKSIPEEKTMLHGDLHIKNIMFLDGETLLIDMDTLCSGHPIYELAFIYNAYKGFGVADPEEVRRFLKISPELAYKLLRRILALYLDTQSEERIDEVEQKASVIGLLRVLRRVIRIGEQNTPEGQKLINRCKNRINIMIENLDTLVF